MIDKSQFIILKHHALRAGEHFDLRIEIPNDPNNMWISFATKKEIPLETGKRILLIKTHLHSKKDALFTGTIPKGEYGAGYYKIYDKGKCNIIKFTSRHIIVEFNGKILKGVYHILSTGVASRQFKSSSYLFFKAAGNIDKYL